VQIKECQTALASVLFSFSVHYVDQTTHRSTPGHVRHPHIRFALRYQS